MPFSEAADNPKFQGRTRETYMDLPAAEPSGLSRARAWILRVMRRLSTNEAETPGQWPIIEAV